MKKFVINVLVLFVMVSICCIIIAIMHFFIIGSQYEYNYQASLIDKVYRLKSIKRPKIILVGHSNLSFGINSEMLEKAMGMPVVNLGLHGGLGNAFHEEIAKLNINAGDIVIVCHSDFSDQDNIKDTLLAWITIDNHRELWKIVRIKDYISMLKTYTDYVKNSFILWATHKGNIDAGGCYSRSAFNEYGDVINKPVDKPVDFSDKANAITVPKIGNECIRRLNNYNEYIASKGATLLIAGYPIAYGEYAKFTESDFVQLKNNLQSVLNFKIISDYQDYFYPYKYFYNTTLHLTKEGTEVRTKQLISDLKKWMSER